MFPCVPSPKSTEYHTPVSRVSAAVSEVLSYRRARERADESCLEYSLALLVALHCGFGEVAKESRNESVGVYRAVAREEALEYGNLVVRSRVGVAEGEVARGRDTCAACACRNVSRRRLRDSFDLPQLLLQFRDPLLERLYLLRDAVNRLRACAKRQKRYKQDCNKNAAKGHTTNATTHDAGTS